PLHLTFGHPRLPPDRLIQGDARAVLDSLADGALDLVYVDPPFATGAARLGRGGLRYDDPADLDEYLGWLLPCLAAARPALATHGSLFVHLDFRAVHHVKIALDRIFGAARLVNEIVWCYSVGGKSPRAFGRKHDTILWYARGKEHAFFPEAVRIPRRAGSHMK